jgi:hypothetical protein
MYVIIFSSITSTLLDFVILHKDPTSCASMYHLDPGAWFQTQSSIACVSINIQTSSIFVSSTENVSRKACSETFNSNIVWY